MGQVDHRVSPFVPDAANGARAVTDDAGWIDAFFGSEAIDQRNKAGTLLARHLDQRKLSGVKHRLDVPPRIVSDGVG